MPITCALMLGIVNVITSSPDRNGVVPGVM